MGFRLPLRCDCLVSPQRNVLSTCVRFAPDGKGTYGRNTCRRWTTTNLETLGRNMVSGVIDASGSVERRIVPLLAPVGHDSRSSLVCTERWQDTYLKSSVNEPARPPPLDWHRPQYRRLEHAGWQCVFGRKPCESTVGDETQFAHCGIHILYCAIGRSLSGLEVRTRCHSTVGKGRHAF
jgi:hypothetical protein